MSDDSGEPSRPGYSEPFFDPDCPGEGPIRNKILDLEELRRKRDAALGKPARPGKAKAKPHEPFYMVQREGLLALAAVFKDHWPTILVAMEVARLVMTRRDGRYVLTEARLAALGITPRGLRTLKRNLAASGEWFFIGCSERGAMTIVLTEQGRKRLCRRGG